MTQSDHPAEWEHKTLDLLDDLVSIRSVNPPGDEDEIAEFAAAYLEERGLAIQRVPLSPGRSSILAQIPGEKEGSVVLCGHLDTVRVREEDWSVPAFETTRRDGRIYGRGTADMKGGVAVLMQAAAWVAGWTERPRHTLKLALTCDEENGYRGAKSLGDGGYLDDTLALIIAEPTDHHVYMGQKAEAWITVSFKGQSAHGSVPHTGVSSLLPAAEFCTAINAEAAKLKPIPGRGKTSLNIGEIHGGWQFNVVPPVTTVKLDFRVISEEDRDKVLELVRGLGTSIAQRTGTTFEMELKRTHSPILGDPEDPWVTAFSEAAQRVTGAAQDVEITPYSTDAIALIETIQPPVIIYGPGSINQAHGADEFVTVDSMNEGLAVYREFLRATLS